MTGHWESSDVYRHNLLRMLQVMVLHTREEDLYVEHVFGTISSPSWPADERSAVTTYLRKINASNVGDVKPMYSHNYSHPLNSIEWGDVSKALNRLRVMILLRCNQVVPATDTPAAAGITHGQ
jgi:hypothetical protein